MFAKILLLKAHWNFSGGAHMECWIVNSKRHRMVASVYRQFFLKVCEKERSEITDAIGRLKSK